MPGIERGNYEQPKKSAWNFEVYDSGHERLMMDRLEADSTVCKWTKRHRITIGWVDNRHRQHSYRPDFLVEYTDGSLALIEVKAANMADSPDVQRKRRAAELWCQSRGMDYSIESITPRPNPPAPTTPHPLAHAAPERSPRPTPDPRCPAPRDSPQAPRPR